MEQVRVKKGDILLYKKKNTLPSKLVSWATKSPYTHVALAMDETKMIDTNFFKVVNIHHINYKREFILLRVNDATEEQFNNTIHLALKKKGSSYDYLRILGMILKYVIKIDFPHTLSLKERFICTEVIDHSYYRTGINLFPHRSPGDIAPADFLKSDRLFVVCIENDA